jgi:hypothetical protein
MGVDDRVDTLSRWMAHHIAGLIANAEAAVDSKARRKAQAEAQEAIIKLWTHRSSYQNQINPLADLRPVLQVIRTLSPDNSSGIPRYFAQRDAAHHVYNAFRRLMIWAFLQKASNADVPKVVKRAKKTEGFQTKEQREILAALELWTGPIAEQQTRSTGKRPSTGDKMQTLTDLRVVGASLIAEARKALDRMEEENTQKAAGAKPVVKGRE